MSNGSSDEQQQTPKGQRRRLWKAAGLTAGAIATLGVAGGAWWVWMFAHERLSPWASEFLSEALDRPVKLGEVERVSLTGVRFGPSALPPTETDPDQLFVEAIDVRFNPLDLLRREVNPQISLTGAQAYIEQNAEGQWVDIEFDLDDDDEEDEDEDTDPLIRVNPTVGIADSEVVLLPFVEGAAMERPFTIADINGSVMVTEVMVEDPREGENTQVDAQEIDLELTASPEYSGDLAINGIIRQLDYGKDAPQNLLDSLDAQIAIQAQGIDLAALAPIALATAPNSVPIAISSGWVNGNVEIELSPLSDPRVTGTARLEDGTLEVNALSLPFTDINTQARFQGNRVALEDTTARYGDLSAQARGTVDLRNGYDLTGSIAPVAFAAIADAFEFEYPINLDGIIQANDVQLTGPLDAPTVTGRVVATDTITVDQVPFADAAAQVTYEPGAVRFEDFTATPVAGGTLAGEGAFVFAEDALELALELAGRNLPADAIAQPYGLPPDLSIGTVTLDADIAGPLDDLNGVVSWNAPDGTYPSRGTAEVTASTVNLRNAAIAGGTVSGVARLNQNQWTADVQAQGLQLGVFNRSLRGVTGGGNVNLAGSTNNFSLGGIRGTGDLVATVRGGTLNSQVSLADGQWTADVDTRNFPVQQFAPAAPVSGLTADARLRGTVDDFSLAAIRGDGVLSAAIAGGAITSDFIIANGTWQLDGRGDNLQLQQLTDDLQGTSDATFQLAGRFDDLTPTGIRGRANLRLSDGLATAGRLSPALARAAAPLEASLAWDGRQLQIERLETGGLSASGTVTPRFTGAAAPSIAAIDLGLRAQAYDLATLPVALPPALAIAGEANFQGRLSGTPNALNFVGDLALLDLALNDLQFEPRLAGDVTYSTQAGLDVALFGDSDEILVSYVPQPRQIDISVQAGDAMAVAETQGNILQARLSNFPVSVLNIPPATSAYGSLRGLVEFASASINLDTFDTVGQFDVLNLGIGFYSVDRLFSGFTYTNGIARLDDGQIIMGDRNDRGELITTRAYNFSGRYSTGTTPQLTATLLTDEGQLRDILEILKIQEIADFRRGFTPNEGFIPDSQAEAEAILATNPVGDPNGTLLNQLRRLSEILERQILEEIAAEEATLPPLSELQGGFSGRVDIAATPPEALQVDFNLTGDRWEWGPDISADTVVARGTYENGLVTLAPLRFSTANTDDTTTASFASLTGDFSIDPDDVTDRQMLLEVVNVPVASIDDFVDLPVDLAGQLNGRATLRGRLGAPALEGELAIVDGVLNGTPIADATAGFSYLNARAGLDAELLIMGSDDPLTLSAQVPYRLPFVDQEPVDQSYLIRANVEDEGLALLNLLTQQVTWEDGRGQVILDIEGDLAADPLPRQFQGQINVEDATIGVSALPEPLRNVTGRIRLVPTTLAIVVEELTGQFSEGQLTAQGAFPLFLPLEDVAAADSREGEGSEGSADASGLSQYDPLSLNLDNIALNLKGLYNGDVDGAMVLGGSLALGPTLSGGIELSNGTITVPESSGAASVQAPPDDDEGPFPPLTFENLRIVLVRNLNIVQGNFLNVNAQGGLRLDGTLNTLRPAGTIRLPAGRIGLFSVALRLAGENDRAEFRGDFDPILDVTLQTALPDATSPEGFGVTRSPFPQNEVSDNTLGNIGLTQQGNSLVRINARYTGPASELANLSTDSRNLELSSSPPRSNSEIIALLSGNVVGALSALESGDALTGIGTFVGSALLNSVRDFLGDTVPISEFRLFQVQEGSGSVNESEEIGAEVGFDVSPNISVSVLKVLTNSTPFQFNTRYRLSDEFTLRGTTSYEDFNDRTGVLLEYETRF